MDVTDPVEQLPGLLAIDAQGAATVLPYMASLLPLKGLAILLKMAQHPVPSEIHLHFDGLQQGPGGMFLEIPLEIGRRGRLLCPENEVKVAAHQTPGINSQALCIHEIVQGVRYHLFIRRSGKYIYLIYSIECQEITGVQRN